MRPRKLSGDDLVILASKWLTVDTEGKKTLPKESCISKETLYRSMDIFGLAFVKSLNLTQTKSPLELTEYNQKNRIQL